MARTALNPTRLTPNGATAQPAGTAGTVDGHFISTDTRTGVRDTVRLDDVTLHVTVATAETDVTVKAGEYPPAIAAGQGDLVTPCPVGVTIIGPFESGRFLRNDGTVHINYETPANVTIRAYAHPRAV